MIFTSYYPVYTLDSVQNSIQNPKGYHKFSIMKTREFSVLWYFYVRYFFGKDEHIMIIDQGADIDYFLDYVKEPYTIVDITTDMKDLFFDSRSEIKLHIRRFKTEVGIINGVKRLYNYVYTLCYRNNIEMFFIENDCLIAHNWLLEAKKYDFATNTIDQHHRVCDTYINYISAKRFHDYDLFLPFDYFLDMVKAQYDSGVEPPFGEAYKDVSCIILNERGIYLRFCYGDVLTFDNYKVLHHGSDEDCLGFIVKYGIDNSFYYDFVRRSSELLKKNI